MQTPIRELPRTQLPRPLIYVTAVACGVFAAMAMQILLRAAAIDLAASWQTLFSAQALQLRSAGPWWLMIGGGFLIGAATAAALSRLPLPWHRLRLLRWLLSALLVAGLAEVGHLASKVPAASGGAHLAVSLAALGGAALMALFGAHFAIRR